MHTSYSKKKKQIQNIILKNLKSIIYFKEKSDVNENNSYNHNFMGKYCTCQKPYPDPEDTNPDEMVQCIMCEDWHHNKVTLN